MKFITAFNVNVPTKSLQVGQSRREKLLPSVLNYKPWFAYAQNP
jgi:hypothetical protein